MERIGWNHFFMLQAYVNTLRVTCERRKVGAVIVKDNRIISSGYNGPPKGVAECPGVQTCTHGKGVGCDYTIHAEVNALLHARREDIEGATLYVTLSPCPSCVKLLIQSGIKEIYYNRPYRTVRQSCQMLMASGIPLHKLFMDHLAEDHAVFADEFIAATNDPELRGYEKYMRLTDKELDRAWRNNDIM